MPERRAGEHGSNCIQVAQRRVSNSGAKHREPRGGGYDGERKREPGEPTETTVELRERRRWTGTAEGRLRDQRQKQHEAAEQCSRCKVDRADGEEGVVQ